MELLSPAFENGSPIPKRYTEEGENISPPLSWKGVPEGTREFALILDDPDAPVEEPWVHWLIYRLPGDLRSLPEGIRREGETRDPPSCQGRNSWGPGNVGYRGPAPPKGHGTHHYNFHLYALDRELDLGPDVERNALEHAMQGHILARAGLTGTYER